MTSAKRRKTSSYDGLDDDLAIGERGHVGGRKKAIECRLRVCSLDLAARDRLVERSADALASRVRARRVGLDEHNVEARPSTDLGDAGAHDATADDAGALEERTHRNAWIPVSAPPTTSAWTSAVPS